MTEQIQKRRGRPPKTNSPEYSGIKSLERGLKLLSIICESDGMNLSDLARAANLPASSTHRLLSTLQACGFVRLEDGRGSWRIGVRAFQVGQAYAGQIDLVEFCRPLMIRLMNTSRETVSIGQLDGDEIIFITQVESPSSIRAFLPPGERGPLHASGCGKAVISTWPAERIRHTMEVKGMTRFTARTICDVEALLYEVEQTLSRGWSINDEEHTSGMRCVAAPIFDASNQAVAAVSISGPKSRVSDADLHGFGELVKGAAMEITQHIGGNLEFFSSSTRPGPGSARHSNIASPRSIIAG